MTEKAPPTLKDRPARGKITRRAHGAPRAHEEEEKEAISESLPEVGEAPPEPDPPTDYPQNAPAPFPVYRRIGVVKLGEHPGVTTVAVPHGAVWRRTEWVETYQHFRALYDYPFQATGDGQANAVVIYSTFRRIEVREGGYDEGQNVIGFVSRDVSRTWYHYAVIDLGEAPPPRPSTLSAPGA